MPSVVKKSALGVASGVIHKQVDGRLSISRCCSLHCDGFRLSIHCKGFCFLLCLPGAVAAGLLFLRAASLPFPWSEAAQGIMLSFHKNSPPLFRHSFYSVLSYSLCLRKANRNFYISLYLLFFSINHSRYQAGQISAQKSRDKYPCLSLT